MNFPQAHFRVLIDSGFLDALRRHDKEPCSISWKTSNRQGSLHHGRRVESRLSAASSNPHDKTNILDLWKTFMAFIWSLFGG
jgi:hypothetical protein